MYQRNLEGMFFYFYFFNHPLPSRTVLDLTVTSLWKWTLVAKALLISSERIFSSPHAKEAQNVDNTICVLRKVYMYVEYHLPMDE